MLRSMTGFGLVTYSDGVKNITVEIKSLNSKFLDLSLRLPKSCAEMEADIRSIISEMLERGKVSLSLEWMVAGASAPVLSINKDLFKAYFSEYQTLANSVGISADTPIFQMALNAPDVQQSPVRETISSEEKELLSQLIREACTKCDAFRKNEGATLEEKIRSYIAGISNGLDAVINLDPARIDKVRNRLKSGIAEWFGSADFDPNRLEQEMIFYIERLDIKEELVRLRSHLDFFLETMKSGKASGRKLAFISQEIGREINTIGSKASDASIQTHVVVMKEELEKIKEQLNNIL